MAKANINILGISEQKWIGMGKFIFSHKHYMYYCWQEFLRISGAVLIVNKRVWNTVLVGSLKNYRMILVCFQGKAFIITVILVYTPTTNAKEATVEWFYENLQVLLELTPKKDVIFITGNWNAVVGTQHIPRVSDKFDLGVQKNALVIATPSSSNTRDNSTHGHHYVVNTKIRLVIFFLAEDGVALYSQQK